MSNEQEPIYYTKRHKLKHLVSPDKHLPNKLESKLLRRLMSQTKMSEIEIRSDKKYRILLSLEQKKKGNKTKIQRYASKLLKGVTKKLKLAKEHPLVKAEFKKIWESRSNYYYGFSSMFTSYKDFI